MAFYAATGDAVSGLTTANDGLLVTSAGGVPSIGNEVGGELTVAGDVKVGSSTTTGAESAPLQVAKDSTISGISVCAFSNDAFNPSIYLNKSRSTTIGSFVTVQDGDSLGGFSVAADDGTSFVKTGGVVCEVNGAVSTGIVPTQMSLMVTNIAGTKYAPVKIYPDGKTEFVEDIEVDGVTVGTGAFASATNTCVGIEALESNVSGNLTTALGAYSLKALDTGTANTALGYGTGNVMTDGEKNVLVGAYAGFVSNGSNNVLMGAYCAQNLTTGSDNTMLGYNIGNGTGGVGAVLTGASENVFLGREASVDTADGSGCISIGWKAVSEASTGATSSDNGPGLALGSATAPVGFRGDGSVYPAAGTSAGYVRIKLNGVNYKMLLLADS